MSLSAIFRDIAPPARWADRFYSWLRFRNKHGRSPRLGPDASYSDHLYRLKVDGSLQDPIRQFVTDKEYLKMYVRSAVGPQHIVKTIQILTTQSDLDQLVLPSFPYVVKPTHMSGEIIFCTHTDRELPKSILKKWLRTNYYRRKREQNYQFLVPKIILEQYVFY